MSGERRVQIAALLLLAGACALYIGLMGAAEEAQHDAAAVQAAKVQE